MSYKYKIRQVSKSCSSISSFYLKKLFRNQRTNLCGQCLLFGVKQQTVYIQ